MKTVNDSRLPFFPHSLYLSTLSAIRCLDNPSPLRAHSHLTPLSNVVSPPPRPLPTAAAPRPLAPSLPRRQCVELDFQYASEGIHRRWDAGFRITSGAATPDQSAFVLSVPRRRPVDETQETLRTSAFPSSHVKEKWAKNLYIAGIAYGRTVS